MTNYCENLTSNTFKIKKEEKERLKKILDNLIGNNKAFIEEMGDFAYGWFGCYKTVVGLDVKNYFKDNEDMINKYKDDEYNAMADELQKCVDEDSYIILTDAGHEKLGYIDGGALIITTNKIEYISLENIAKKRAMELLGVHQN